MPIHNIATLVTDAASVAYTSRLEIRAFEDVDRKIRHFDRGFVAPINPESLKITYKNNLAGQVGLNSTGASLSVASNEAEEISFKLVLTDSSAFHYMGRNLFTPLNDYHADTESNVSYLLGLGIDLANETDPVAYLKPKKKEGKIAKLNPKTLQREGHVAIAIERFLNLTTQDALKIKDDHRETYLGLVWGSVFTRPGKSDDKGFTANRQRVYPCYLESVDVNYTHFTRDGRVLRAELDCVFKEDSSDNG